MQNWSKQLIIINLKSWCLIYLMSCQLSDLLLQGSYDPTENIYLLIHKVPFGSPALTSAWEKGWFCQFVECVEQPLPLDCAHPGYYLLCPGLRSLTGHIPSTCWSAEWIQECVCWSTKVAARALWVVWLSTLFFPLEGKSGLLKGWIMTQ